jgi:hypothetical protein
MSRSGGKSTLTPSERSPRLSKEHRVFRGQFIKDKIFQCESRADQGYFYE